MSRGRRLGLLLAPFLLLVAVSFGTDLLIHRSQLVRVVRWLDADMADYDRFPRREIAPGPETFRFVEAPAPRDSGAFAPITGELEGRPFERDFESFLEWTDTHAFLVVVRDTLIFEWYRPGHGRGTVETTFSISKSLVSLATGVAIEQGWISGVEAPVTEYVPELRDRDPAFDRLTIAHLLTMTSGIRFSRGKSPWGDEATSYYAPNLRSVAKTRELAEDPGSGFQYNFYAPIVLGLALERASGRELTTLLSQAIWSRIGAEYPASWSLDSPRSGFEKMESGFNAAPIDLAKLGRLYLREGDWNGRQIVSADWVRESVRPDSTHGRAPRYGYYWHLRTAADSSRTFWAEGRFGQFIYVAPAANAVIVRTGSSTGQASWPEIFERVVGRLD